MSWIPFSVGGTSESFFIRMLHYSSYQCLYFTPNAQLSHESLSYLQLSLDVQHLVSEENQTSIVEHLLCDNFSFYNSSNLCSTTPSVFNSEFGHVHDATDTVAGMHVMESTIYFTEFPIMSNIFVD